MKILVSFQGFKNVSGMVEELKRTSRVVDGCWAASA
jgi:hypothetical protein